MQIRSLPNDGGGGDMVVEGYATTFNQPYLLYSEEDFEAWEEVDERAFDDCDMRDVIMQYDHQGRVFARTKNNTLQLAPDAHGLKITADLGGTDLGKQLYGEIKGGYTDQMSFGFRVGLDERTYTKNHETGKLIGKRRIKKFSKLYDVSAVSVPANPATDLHTRSLNDGWIEEVKAERLRAQKVARLALKIKMMEEH